MEMERLRDIVSQMDVAAHPKGRQQAARTKASVTLEGTVDEIMSRLSDALEEDYAENVSECVHAPWDFDYVVTDDTPTKGAIEIYTRLFNPSDANMGSSFYGRTVRRVSSDRYMLWIDD